MGKWLSKFLDGCLASDPDIPDTLVSLSGVSGGDRVHANLTVNAAHPSSTVYWASEGTILGPASVSYEAKSRDQFYVCVEWQDTFRWIHESLLRSKRDFKQHGRQICNCCGGIEFWHSIHGATLCRTCHPPSHPSVVKRWL